MNTKNPNLLKIALVQMAPEWLDGAKTLEKVAASLQQAGDEKCRLAVFGEALVPGYPFWVERTDGARFESDLQKEMYAYYLQQAVNIEDGDLKAISKICAEKQIATYLGTIERAADRGGHSLYCSLVFIDENGDIASVHRKLMPTYEERLVWATGDGHGLQVHKLGAFTLGGLNCWENWMPLSRTALYALGEDLHIAVWPGSERNTFDITRFIAKESRSFVASVCGLMTADAISPKIPHFEAVRNALATPAANGGTCLAGPDGAWIIEPVVDKETLLIAEIDHAAVRRARHNFDPAGHYARPDVTRLTVDRRRQNLARFVDN